MRRAESVPLRPAFYARISQDRAGLSIGVRDQIEQGRAHLAKLGWPEPVIYEDNDISARSGRRRPGFEQMLADIQAGVVDGLAARHLDRLLRRVTDLERVLDALDKRPMPVALEQGSEIDLSTASGRLLARILASVAANESEIKGERVGAARRREAHSGRAHGHLGYGYDEHQQVVAREAQVIREVASRIIDGQSLRSIAIDLNERGEPTPGAGRWDARRVAKVVQRSERPELVALIELARSPRPVSAEVFARALKAAGTATTWTAAQVREQTWAQHLTGDGQGMDDSSIAELLRDTGVQADATSWRAANLRAMIRRGALCGWREFSPGKRGGSGDLVARGEWQPILSKETTEQIRRITDRPGVRGRTPKHLLAGILRCGSCGSPMGGSPDGRGGTRYACSKQPGLPERCGGLTIAAKPVEAMVARAVIDTLAEANVRSSTLRRSAIPAEVVKAEEDYARLKERLDDLGPAYAAEEITLDQMKSATKDLMARMNAAKKIAGAWTPATKVVLRDVPVDRMEIQSWWDTQGTPRRRDVIAVLIDSIPVAPANRARRFNPQRVGDPVWKI